MRIDFAGKTVVVTGGTGALGTSVVAAFAGAGARVVASYIDDAELEPFRAALGDHLDQVDVHRCDLTQRAAAEQLLAVSQEHGAPRAVVNLAGGYQWGAVADTDDATLERLLDLNLRTTFNTCRAAAPVLTAAGAGSIVAVSARAALRGEAGNGPYGATKAAVLALTQALDAELRDHGVNANAVLPSIIDTPANRDAMPKSDFDRWVAPEQLASVIVFLASDAARAIHGAGIPVYGRA